MDGTVTEHAPTASAADRPVLRLVPGTRTLEGGGFPVRRPFPTPLLDSLDPFLLLDELGPVDYGPGEAVGAPAHPHRGFETVTYLRSGRMVHRDSTGRSGRLAPGDVQWMTAGAGVVHSELPDETLLREGGRLHGFQLWVNLPRRDKRVAPRYQDVPSASIPELALPGGGRLRLVAGAHEGRRGPVETRIPLFYGHATLPPGARLEVAVPRGWNAFAWVFCGAVRAGVEAREVRDGHLAIFGDGTRVRLEGAVGAAQVLLGAGEPLGEPVARYGPFVMNTREEIARAFEDYRAGRLGAVDG